MRTGAAFSLQALDRLFIGRLEVQRRAVDAGAVLRRLGITVATGVFQAMMSVELVNEGPVTILLDSDKKF